MRYSFIIFALVFLTFIACEGQTRNPSQNQQVEQKNDTDNPKYEIDSLIELSSITADFNGDGRIDKVALKKASKKTILVFTSDVKGQNKQKAIDEFRTSPHGYILSIRKPGKIIHACEKGYGEKCPDNISTKLSIKTNMIQVNVPESSHWVYYWQDGEFIRMFLSD